MDSITKVMRTFRVPASSLQWKVTYAVTSCNGSEPHGEDISSCFYSYDFLSVSTLAYSMPSIELCEFVYILIK